mgnify:CR=1 FL=1
MSVVFKPLSEFGFDRAHFLGLQLLKHGLERGGGITLARRKPATDHVLDVVGRFLLISKHRHIAPLLVHLIFGPI